MEHQGKAMNLYRVVLQGMTSSFGGTPAYGNSYVIADNPNEAYQKVRSFLDENNIGMERDREMKKIELIASEGRFNNVGIMLFM